MTTVLLSCNDNGREPDDSSINADSSLAQDAGAIEISPIVLPENGTLIINGLNDFSFSLFEEIYATGSGENIVFSPYNMYVHLAMLANGNPEGVSAELFEAMGLRDYNLSIDDINTLSWVLIPGLSTVDANAVLTTANSIWHSWELNPAMMRLLSYSYGIEDFSLDTMEGAQTAISAWVKEKTSGMIPEISFNPGSEECVFVNTSCFKGSWAPHCEFNPELTAKETFNNHDGSSSLADFMWCKGVSPYFSNESFRGTMLEFGNGSFSLYLMLPQEGKGLKESLQALQGHDFFKSLGEFDAVNLTLRLPKFENYSSLSLTELLRNKGVRSMFEDGLDRVYFDGKTYKAGDHRQQVYFSIDEKGAKGAAVDYNDFGALIVERKETLDFDSPFVYVLRENTSGAIIYIGTVTHF